jgi:hypothetical protein
MKKLKKSKTVVKLDWTKENELKIENSIGTKIKIQKPVDLKTWKYKVLGETPKGTRAVKV